ncbi:hypothetical protein LOK49_LG13G01780 [Camellia lanceoleosa]|uniref:Uncharacterized protein n=1 Tax=Camellia lanceoleosa TaxID=1840588 RepID=A0ACC0FK17_9ERIC|nr:hypothetical protein LOK49_LG13G01780 [Camellia lanceoleosa]
MTADRQQRVPDRSHTLSVAAKTSRWPLATAGESSLPPPVKYVLILRTHPNPAQNLQRKKNRSRERQRKSQTQRVKHLHCMDIKTLSEEASLELARELLIAISLCVPEKVLNLVASENLNNGNGAVVTNSDEDEELRSKLISIAYVQPPDASA